MYTMFHRALSLVCLVAMCVCADIYAAQQTATPPSLQSSTGAPGVARGRVFRGVKGLPYSANQDEVTTQTLTDGTKITTQTHTKSYRDSEGRTRREFYASPADTDSLTPVSVMIYDPVADVRYQLSPRSQTARKLERRHATRAPAAQPNVAPAQRRDAQPSSTAQDLGEEIMDGLNVHGWRETTVLPVGLEGNDRPLEVTDETWGSAELSLTVMTIHNDPRSGETVTRLTNIVRGEPPAELFQVPADYTLEELQTVQNPASGPE